MSSLMQLIKSPKVVDATRRATSEVRAFSTERKDSATVTQVTTARTVSLMMTMNAKTSRVIGWHTVVTPMVRIPVRAFRDFKATDTSVLRLLEINDATPSVILIVNINECETGIAKCPEYSTCVNLPGTYFCNCTEGFQPLGIPLERCADIDECAKEMHNCPENFKCQNEIGGFKCVQKCDAGYRLVNGTCVDVDECAEKTSKCNKRASCVNTVGGYQCTCEDGFTGDGKNCTHINECATKQNPCEGQGGELRCVNIDGGYICCEQHLDDKRCIREKGAFCSGGCGLHAVCYNETCQCMEGFSGDPRIKCSDVNECEDDRQCPGAGEWCVNLLGGFICCRADSENPECLGSNFEVDGIRRTFSSGSTQQKETGNFLIIDKQVISAGQFGLACYFGCPADSHCVNDTCRCNDGFIGNTFEGCADVNECDLGLCNQPDSWCVNLRGSFACCTRNSTLSHCIGVEITDNRENSFAAANTNSLSSAVRGGIGTATFRSDNINSGADNDSTNDSWSDKFGRNEFGSGGRSSSWVIEKVGEWKNFTGHAIIIGRGRIESKKWNVTGDGNGTMIDSGVEKNVESSTKKEEAEDEKGRQTKGKGSGEGAKTDGTDGTTSRRILEAITSLSSEANKSSEKGSDGILAVTTASSLLNVSNFGGVHKIGEEEIEKADIIIFQSSKAPPNHTHIESKMSLERSSESSIIVTPKTLALQNFEVVSSEVKTGQGNSRKSFEIPKASVHSKGAELVPEAKSMKGEKLENAAILENGRAKTAIALTKNDLSKSNELIGAKSSIEMIEARTGDGEILLTTPSVVEEKHKTTARTALKSSEIQVPLADKEIDDSLAVPYQTMIDETKTSPFVPESKSQWTKEEEQKLQLSNTTSEAEVAIIVKEESVIPTVIEVTPIVTTAKSDLPNSTAVSERSGKLHDASLKVGLEKAKVALTTESEIGIEIVAASVKYAPESGSSVEADTSSIPYAKSTKPVVQLIESSVKFGSDLATTTTSQKTTKSEFIQTSVPVEMTQNGTKTSTSDKSSEQPTKKIESTEASSFALTSANSKGDDTVSRDTVTAASSASARLSFDQQLATTTPNEALSKPESDDESSGTISTQNLNATSNKEATGSDTEVVAETQSVARDDEDSSMSTEHRHVHPAKGIEVEGSGEEATYLQTTRSAEDFVSTTAIETNDPSKEHLTVATSDRVIGLEIVRVKGYPKTTEASLHLTNASLRKNWTDAVIISQDAIVNASLSSVLTTKTDKEDVKFASDSAKTKSTAGEFATFHSQELGSTFNIYKSETTSTSASDTSEIAVTSKQSEFESTFPTIQETHETRLESTFKPTDNDKTDGKLGTVAAPQSKDSSMAFASSTTKEILAKASGTSEESVSSTTEDIAKIKSVSEEVRRGVVTTVERIVHFSDSVAAHVNNTSGSVAVTEATMWKPTTSNVTGKNIFGNELVISIISKDASVETQPGATTSRSPNLKITEVLGMAKVIGAPGEATKETAFNMTEFTATVSEVTSTSATGTNGFAASVATTEGTKISAIPETVKIETFPTSESAFTRGTEHEISRTIAPSDIFPHSNSAEVLLTIPLSIPSSVTTVEQRISTLKSDETNGSKLETTTESVASGNGTETSTSKSVKDEGFSMLMTTTTGKASTLESASIGPIARERASSVFGTSLPSVEIVERNGSTSTVPNRESYPTLSFISETKGSASLATPSIITFPPRTSKTSLESAVSRTTVAESTVGLHHFGSSKTDFSSTLTLPKSNLKLVASTGNTDLLKVEPTVTRWTSKSETRKSENVPGDGSLLKITQQETVTPLYANISKSEQRGTATSVQNDTDGDVASLRCRSNDECGIDAYCERRSGVCRCYPGFHGQPPVTACIDINECDRHLDDCDATSRCSNKVGGFVCFCETGYRMSADRICVDIDECRERVGRPCSQYATCTNIPGSYRCQCNFGYTGDGYTCIPIEKRHCKREELAKSNCGSNHLCLVDGSGVIDCDSCKKGFMKDGASCTDINECLQSGICHENAFCKNIVGSYSCHCHPGYKGDGSICDDIDECANNPCHPQATCINHAGSFTCKCPDNWVGDGQNECINPSDTACLDKVLVCKQTNHTSCLSVNLGFTTTSVCECASNYRYNSITHTCEDIDECVENRHNCDPSNSACVNTDGGYICECSPGYEGVGGLCVDVDECERGIAGCNMAALCENYVGSVGCKCPQGFTGNGIHCAATESFIKADSGCNDEWRRTCNNVNRTCHIDDEDVPQCGSCIIGYQPLNGRCLPIQEAGNCANPEKNDCDVNAECIDVKPDRHFCTCKVGYIGDGRHCDDVDECSLADVCDPAAICRNINGSFTCTCQFGYIGNGFKCTPKLNKFGGPNCHLNVSMCHKNARCQLSGICKCNNGYEGDGVNVCQLEDDKKQDDKTSASNITEVSTVVHSETEERSATLNYDSVSDSGFTSSLAVMPVTVCAFVQLQESKVTETIKDIATQQSSAATSKSINATEESIETGTTTVVASFKTSTSWRSEIIPVTVSEGSGEDDSMDKDWDHIITPDQLFTSTVLSSERASVHEDRKEATNVSGSDAWTYPHSTSSLRSPVIPERAEKVTVGSCTTARKSACHELAICVEESGKCVCKVGYHGDGYSICMKDTGNCTFDPTVCDSRAVCDVSTHTCKCIQGYIGDGIICAPDTFDCLLRPNLCSNFAECIGRRCICNAGYTGDGTECVTVEPLHDCTRCDIKAKCFNETCICDKGYFGNGAVCFADPSDCIHYPGLCHSNAICDEEKRRCYIGNGMECNRKKDLLCFNNASICDQNAECHSTGICQCKKGFEGDGYYCRADIDECVMGTHDCNPVAHCNNTPGSFTCVCPTGYRGNGRKCSQHHPLHNMSVDCELDGMNVILANDPDLYGGRIFVRGQTDNPFCSMKLSTLLANETEYHLTVKYAHCNVRFEEPNTIAVTVVIQRHPMFITERADAYNIRCTYPVDVRKVASHVGISEITTTKTIVETGIGPTCSLTVTNEQDQLIDTATVGQPLKLALTVSPNDTYAVLPRNCFAINLETGELYLLTDQSGCAIDTELFPEWTYRQLWLTTARFRTFKWPDSSMIRFQCDCAACIESCPKINCTKRRESIKQRHFRHIREISRKSIDEELEKHIIKGRKWMAYSGALHVNEEEELVRAQRDMKRWKYQGLKSYDETMDILDSPDGICLRSLWIILSLLPLLLLLVVIGSLSVIWRNKSLAKIRLRNGDSNDSKSPYFKF
ncbi:unnamed protein product [Litomosoides sigmodontis]|uniref:Uncharacterized protein n=1 Tax=Litomosoides sigmodontis TaxID=42156 RepID=A0A3P6U0K8_LITSI|nr:unnamed protein product [Litomosoides sigmodontis]